MRSIFAFLWKKFVTALPVAAFLLFLSVVGGAAHAGANLEIVDARFDVSNIEEGRWVQGFASLRNTGDTTALMAGPESNVAYQEGKSFLSYGYGLETGKYRVGVDFSGSHDIAGITYPYRAGVNRAVAPGETAELFLSFQPRIGVRVYSFGVVQEGVGWTSDHVFPQTITVTPRTISTPITAPSYKAAQITGFFYFFSPVDGKSALDVFITVKNIGTATLDCQGPLSDFPYNESQSFRTLGYLDIPGSFRVGIDFPGSHNSLGITYPYRWGCSDGFGGPGHILPGSEVNIHGRIIFDEPKTLVIGTGAVIEGEKWMSDWSNRTTIVVPPVIDIPISTPISTPISSPISMPVLANLALAFGSSLEEIAQQLDFAGNRASDNGNTATEESQVILDEVSTSAGGALGSVEAQVVDVSSNTHSSSSRARALQGSIAVGTQASLGGWRKTNYAYFSPETNLFISPETNLFISILRFLRNITMRVFSI